MIDIIIDNRENKLIQLFENNNNKIIKQNLEIGDIIFNYDNNPLIIIERKTLSDLCASIKDGRYKEQKMRMINNYQNCKKIYLIENIGEFNLSKSILLSSKINCTLRDNISVLESNSLENTYEIIMKIFNNIPKYIEQLLNKNIIKEDYVNCIQSNKKANLTKENIEILQLCVIPGVSKNIAKIILNYYGSLMILYNNINNNSDDIINEISELKNGKRKLGNKFASKFINFIK